MAREAINVKLLLHTCCAPCAVACVKALRAEGIEPTAYWYNPNIHPHEEYRARRDTLLAYAAGIGLAVEADDDYGLRPFAGAVSGELSRRCITCYAARLRHTARRAKAGGYTHFTSTLLISPYQNHELLRAAGEQAAAEYGVIFLYRDFRPLFREGQAEARSLGLYMQKYCGCVFSEQERFDKRYRAKPAPRATAPDTADDAAARELAWPALRAAGERFEAAQAEAQAALAGTETNRAAAKDAAQSEASTAQAGSPAAELQSADAQQAGENPLVALVRVQTERTLWEARNVMRCAADCGLWEAVYCEQPVWRHVYHMLHSLDRWYMDPGSFMEPDIHVEGLNDLDKNVNAPVFSLSAMESYLDGITEKLRAYLTALRDDELALPPEGSQSARLALAVAAIRHLTAHFGMVMGFVIAERGKWPLTIGMQGVLPMVDDGLPHYA